MCLPQQQVDGGSGVVFDTQVVVALDNGVSPQVVLSEPTADTEPQLSEVTSGSNEYMRIDSTISLSATDIFFTYILVRDILFGFCTIIGGLIIGKIIVVNVDNIFGSTVAGPMVRRIGPFYETVTSLSVNHTTEIPTISIENITVEGNPDWTNYNNESQIIISPFNLTVLNTSATTVINGNVSDLTNSSVSWSKWYRYIMDLKGPHIQIYKEVGAGAIIMLLLLRFLEVPMTRTIFGQEYKFGERALLVIFWIKLFLVELCCVGLVIIVFDRRFCNPKFDVSLMRGPVGAMAYVLNNVSTTFQDLFLTKFQSEYEGGFEIILTLPLTLAISFPVYTVLKYYWTHVEGIKATEGPVYYCFDLCRLELIGSKCILYSGLLEVGEIIIVCFGIRELIKLIAMVNMTLLVSSCLVMTPLSLSVGYLIIYIESRCPKLFEYTRHNYWYRISANLYSFCLFVPDLFTFYFWNVRPDAITCESGRMTTNNVVSMQFLLCSTVCTYAGWKIVFLCMSSNSKESFDLSIAAKTDKENTSGDGVGKSTALDV